MVAVIIRRHVLDSRLRARYSLYVRQESSYPLALRASCHRTAGSYSGSYCITLLGQRELGTLGVCN